MAHVVTGAELRAAIITANEETARQGRVGSCNALLGGPVHEYSIDGILDLDRVAEILNDYASTLVHVEHRGPIS
jgi:hypothetical protein